MLLHKCVAALLLFFVPLLLAYDIGAEVTVTADRIWPKGNPIETYSFSQFPFCTNVNTTQQDFTQDISGSRRERLAHELFFARDEAMKTLCIKQLPKTQVPLLRRAVQNKYFALLFIGMPPVTCNTYIFS